MAAADDPRIAAIALRVWAELPEATLEQMGTALAEIDEVLREEGESSAAGDSESAPADEQPAPDSLAETVVSFLLLNDPELADHERFVRRLLAISLESDGWRPAD